MCSVAAALPEPRNSATAPEVGHRSATIGRPPVSRNRPFGVNRTEARAGLLRSVRLAWQRPVAVCHTRLRGREQGRRAGRQREGRIDGTARNNEPAAAAAKDSGRLQRQASNCAQAHSREAVEAARGDELALALLAAEGHPRQRVGVPRYPFDRLPAAHVPHDERLVKAAADLSSRARVAERARCSTERSRRVSPPARPPSHAATAALPPGGGCPCRRRAALPATPRISPAGLSRR